MPLIQLTFVVLTTSMTLWIGGLMFNLLRAEMHFRSGEALRILVAVVDTEWAERRILLPAGLLFGASGSVLVATGETALSSVYVVIGMVMFIGVIGTSVGYLLPKARRINELQRLNGAEDDAVLRLERHYLFVMRARAAAGIALVVVTSFIYGP